MSWLALDTSWPSRLRSAHRPPQRGSSKALSAFVSSLHHGRSDVFAPDALLPDLWARGPRAYIDHRPALAAVV